jgi:hypothetical protein
MAQFAPFDGVPFPMRAGGADRAVHALMAPSEKLPTSMSELMLQFYSGDLPTRCHLGDALLAGVIKMLISTTTLLHPFDGCPMWVHEVAAALPASVDDRARIATLWRVLHDQVGITRDAWRLSAATRALRLAAKPPRPLRLAATPYPDSVVQHICMVAVNGGGVFPIPTSDVAPDGALTGASAALSHLGWRIVTWDDERAFSRPRGAVECEPIDNRTVYAELTARTESPDGETGLAEPASHDASLLIEDTDGAELGDAGVLLFNLTKTAGVPLEVTSTFMPTNDEGGASKVIGLRDCIDAVMAEVLQRGAASMSWGRTSVAMLQERVRCEVHFAVRKHGLSDTFDAKHSEIVYSIGSDPAKLVVPIVTIKRAIWGAATPNAPFAMRPNGRGGHTLEFDFEHQADLEEVLELTGWRRVGAAVVKPAMPYSAPRCSVRVLVAP